MTERRDNKLSSCLFLKSALNRSLGTKDADCTHLGASFSYYSAIRLATIACSFPEMMVLKRNLICDLSLKVEPRLGPG